MNFTRTLGVVLFVLLLSPFVCAQSNEKVQQTYMGPDVSTLWELLKEPKAKDARVDVLKFMPAGDSGVATALGEAIGATPEERTALVQAFKGLKQVYEAKVARELKPNNLAAAMAYFIAANVMAYHHTEMPLDSYVPKLMESLQQAMARIPAFAKNLKLSGARIIVDAPVNTAASSVNGKILGAWTTSSAMNGGHFRLRYIFNADGSYSFKSERNHTSQRWWTIEESGTFSVNGDTLTINPQTSKATLRNLNGVVQETRANPLEKVNYKWTTHFFEGIGETNLVLQPPAATSRDGILGSNSLFPNAYLYTQGDKLEWRF